MVACAETSINRLSRAVYVPQLEVVTCLPNPGASPCFGDSGYLTHRDPGKVHLEDRLFYVPAHALVTLKYLRYELALTVSGHLQALDLSRGGHQVALVVPIALSSLCGCDLPGLGAHPM